MTRAPVTVIVACHTSDRWDTLVPSIQSASSQEPPPEAIVVAVDNNPPLAQRLRESDLGVSVVENSGAPGASNARNIGASRASTPFLAFLDDDSFAEPGWVESLLRPFADPQVVGTGGPVVPDWRVSRPRWFPDEFAWVVGTSYTGLPRVSAPVRNVWSVNMAVRRDVFAAVGGFRSEFGKVGRTSRPEDTDLCIRMSASAPNGHWIYVPEAVVRHDVPADRSTVRYFLRRSYWEGQGKVEMARYLGAQEGLRSERAWLMRTVPAGIWNHARATFGNGGSREAARAGALLAGLAAAGAGAATSLVRGVASRRATRRQPPNH